jgi:hypothetical protein
VDKEALFDVWVHPGAVWAEWVKPVLFAHLPRALPPFSHPPLPDLSWVPAPAERWAIVVDLPGALAVAVGLALAEKGYRPVPLFNGCPPPEGDESLAVIDVEPTLAGLVEGGPRLQALPLPLDAPPAFLVDANRNSPRRLADLETEAFYNVSTLFETDFPSAEFLRAVGLTGVLWLCERERVPAADLGYVLRLWQRGGLALGVKRLSEWGGLRPLAGGGLWLLYRFLHRLWASISLRPCPMGGYGDFLPGPSGG